MPKISFRNVKKVYPSGSYALDNISFDIEQGDFVSIIGESGGGKTTLLKLIAGLEKATCGEIYFDNEISNYLKVAKRDVAFMFQDYTIYPNMTVFENILLSLNSQKISYEAKCELTWNIIKKMKLEYINGELPKSLSFGQCQKVALAKVLIRKPKIVLFDEPLSNLDVLSKADYKKLILEAKSLLPNSTFVYVTHNINDAIQLSNKIMVIHEGKLLQYNDKNIVYEYPNSKIVADYLYIDKQVLSGYIEKGVFISNNISIPLSQIQKSSLSKDKVDEVVCYISGNITNYFDMNGNVISGVKKQLLIASYTYNDTLIIFNKEYNIKEFKQAFLKEGHINLVFNLDLFSLKKINNSIEFIGKVFLVCSEYVIVKIENFFIPFKNINYQKEDKVEIYYSMDILKGIDNDGNHIISSYIISDNSIDVKVINLKKGIIRFAGKNVQNDIFIGSKNNIKIRIPIEAFEFCDSGEYVCDELFNEENLGDYTLIHFSCKKISSYLSAKISNPFKGFNMKKIKFNINFDKLVLEK